MSAIWKCLPFLLLAQTVFAQMSEPMELAYSGRVAPPMTGPHVLEDKASSADTPPSWDRALPFFAQRVIDRGIELPNPYDVGVSLYMGREDRALSSLQVGFNGRPMDNLGFVSFPHTRVETQSTQLQVGAWVLPFLNIYGIVGYTKGSGDIDIAIPGRDLMEYLNVPGCNLGPLLRPDLCSQTLRGTAHAHYDGPSAGLGMTLAGAWRNIFFALPITYVVSDLSVSATNSKTWNIAPRVGYNLHTKDSGLFTFYAGGTYMKSSFNITGQFNFDTSGTVLAAPTSMQYSIHVEPENRWNYLAGLNWTINRNWGVLAEVGFGGARQDLLLNAFFRF